MSMINTNNTQSRSLWLGDVDSWMNEDFIKSIFKDYGNKIIKIISKNSNQKCKNNSRQGKTFR